MVDKNLVGRCGLYCGACGIYRAYRDGGEFRRRLAEFFKCPPEKVRCEGCQVLTPECWGIDCKIVKCLNVKGLRFCYECADYESHTCKRFEKFSGEYLKEDDVDLRANLERIKTGEVDEWLEESERKFRCSHCGKPLPTNSFRKKCYHCGKELAR
ncbi:MAG: DUF3795 domain-containing protein [Candidatus Bathyarchaeota archaeon]|nr:MAG: DUF3795 domain-containing protein [Candidatus Bathyarchaeota archaeon]